MIYPPVHYVIAIAREAICIYYYQIVISEKVYCST